jgi:hypothetical protein
MAMSSVNTPQQKSASNGGKLKAFSDWLGVAVNLGSLANSTQDLMDKRAAAALAKKATEIKSPTEATGAVERLEIG